MAFNFSFFASRFSISQPRNFWKHIYNNTFNTHADIKYSYLWGAQMKVTFDSNAWEEIFSLTSNFGVIAAALRARTIQGFICASSFRIEAIQKQNRNSYFQEPRMGFDFGVTSVDCQPMLRLSFGPDDTRHPGLPAQQREKLERAFAAGILLIHGGNWLGLPSPKEIAGNAKFVAEDEQERSVREQREIDAFWQIEQRGVGKSVFDAEGGWEIRTRDKSAERRLSRACAEWADAETVSAHIAYQHDILCTNDRGRRAGNSIFNDINRDWLTNTFGVRFMTVEELAVTLK